MLQKPGLFVTYSEGKGRGVFTAQDIGVGDLIEVCPIILIPQAQLQQIHETIMHDYYFLWPGEDGAACIALGLGSIYNHDAKPNAEIVFDISKKEIELKCIKAIAAGEEIFIDYTGADKNAPDLWFKAV